jgi:hypothetical protein
MSVVVDYEKHEGIAAAVVADHFLALSHDGWVLVRSYFDGDGFHDVSEFRLCLTIRSMTFTPGIATLPFIREI